MALSEPELQLLGGYLNGNRLLIPIGTTNYEAIAQFCDNQPTEEELFSNLILALTPKDRTELFSNSDFKKWYCIFSERIDKDTTIKIRKSPTEQFTNLEIDLTSVQLLGNIISNGQVDLATQELLLQLINSDRETLTLLMVCFGASGIFAETTLFVLNVELAGVVRWQAIGISEAPTAQEVETVLNF